MPLDRYSDTSRAVLGQRARLWTPGEVDHEAERAMAAIRLRTELAALLVDEAMPALVAVERVHHMTDAFLHGSWMPWRWPWPEDD